MANDHDPYTVLGVPHGTPVKDIKLAYRKLALKYHLDKAGPSYTGRFQQIQGAWEKIEDGYESPKQQRQPTRAQTRTRPKHGKQQQRQHTTSQSETESAYWQSYQRQKEEARAKQQADYRRAMEAMNRAAAEARREAGAMREEMLREAAKARREADAMRAEMIREAAKARREADAFRVGILREAAEARRRDAEAERQAEFRQSYEWRWGNQEPSQEEVRAWERSRAARVFAGMKFNMNGNMPNTGTASDAYRQVPRRIRANVGQPLPNAGTADPFAIQARWKLDNMQFKWNDKNANNVNAGTEPDNSRSTPYARTGSRDDRKGKQRHARATSDTQSVSSDDLMDVDDY